MAKFSFARPRSLNVVQIENQFRDITSKCLNLGVFCALSIFIGFPQQSMALGSDLEMLNVTTFGAIPDDDKDDTVAIQSAIDNALAPAKKSKRQSPKTIFIPKGVFLVKGLVISGNNLRLQGMGADASILRHVENAAPVIHLKGACYTSITELGIEGSSSSTYGVLIDDTSTSQTTGGLPAWKGALSAVRIANVRGNPGIGLANTGRAHSWSIRNSMIRDNRIGIKLIRASQNTTIEGSTILFNLEQQLILGDGNNFIRGINIRDSNIEGTFTGTTELIRANGVSPLNIDSIYLESHRGGKDALDLLTVGLPSSILIDGLYSNGGVTSPLKQSFLFKAETALTMSNAQFIGTQQAIQVAESDPENSRAMPKASRIQVSGSRGPGLKNGIQLTQGADSWNDGISLGYGKHTWDLVVGREGFLWFGYNGKTSAILLPSGELKKP